MNARPLFLFLLLAIFLAPAVHAGGPDHPKATFTGYDEKADPAQDIAAACTAARARQQRVLVIFGANACGPCRKLHALLFGNKTVAALLAARYQVVPVAVDGRQAAPTRARYGYTPAFGLPSLAVLSADGSLLKLQATREFAEGNHQDGGKVLAFLREWAGSAP
jgi:hypothetical protein